MSGSMHPAKAFQPQISATWPTNLSSKHPQTASNCRFVNRMVQQSQSWLPEVIKQSLQVPQAILLQVLEGPHLPFKPQLASHSRTHPHSHCTKQSGKTVGGTLPSGARRHDRLHHAMPCQHSETPLASHMIYTVFSAALHGCRCSCPCCWSALPAHASHRIAGWCRSCGLWCAALGGGLCRHAGPAQPACMPDCSATDPMQRGAGPSARAC